MKHVSIFRRIGANSSGAAAVEFALVAPMVIGLMLGMFQVSIAMYNYNSLRGAVDDTARYTIVDFQKETRSNEQALNTAARTIATSSPYNLDSDRLDDDPIVELLDDSRVAGALEATITMRYNVPSVARFVGMGDIQIEYSRPVFLIS
jgi:Flp pilus assembly pilin Flp